MIPFSPLLIPALYTCRLRGNMKLQTSQQIIEVLSEKGHAAESLVPYFVRIEWDDGKLRLVGHIDVSSREYDLIIAYVHHPASKPETKTVAQTVFALPSISNASEWTQVFEDYHGRIYRRKGRWEEHLRRLCEEILSERERLQELHGIAIDDSSLFQT